MGTEPCGATVRATTLASSQTRTLLKQKPLQPEAASALWSLEITAAP